MDNYRENLYRATWSVVYRQLQDAIFFTRAEVYLIDFSTNNYLKLCITWCNHDELYHQCEFKFSFDLDFPKNISCLLQCINDILAQASYNDCNCMAPVIGGTNCY